MNYEVRCMNEELFNKVLNENESIRKILKPQGVSFILKSLLLFTYIVLIMLVLIVVAAAEHSTVGITICASCLGICIIFSLIYVLLLYKNTFYCITNKRLIKRSGVFGIDFQFLDFADVEAIDVNVSLINKMCGNKSGSILIGTKARPIVSMASSFVFRDVLNPYELSKKFKEYVDYLKGNKSQVKSNLEKKDALAEIERLKKLLDEKVITQEEFEKLKSQLLND